MNETTAYAHLSLIQFKVLHQMRFARTTFTGMKTGVQQASPMCLVMPILNQFWSQVYRILSVIVIDIECIIYITVFKMKVMSYKFATLLFIVIKKRKRNPEEFEYTTNV